MAEAYLGEIRVFPFGFAPNNWAQCNGQLLQVSQYQALFSLLGTTYGGDGRSTFGVPNFSGRAPIHPQSGQALGTMLGSETHTLTPNELPSHGHPLNVSNAIATLEDPTNNALANCGPESIYANSANTTMNSHVVNPTGASQAHANMQPFIVVNFCICVNGIFPPQPT